MLTYAGFWSFVFPVGVYSNAWCVMSNDLRNEAMRGWAAACVMATILLWLACALSTVYKGVWRGKLFFSPGLQGWVEQKEIDAIEKRRKEAPEERQSKENAYGMATGRYGNDLDHVTSRYAEADGTYTAQTQRLPRYNGEDGHS